MAPFAVILILLTCISTVFSTDDVSPVLNLARDLRKGMTPEERKDPIIIAESNSHFHCLTQWWIDKMGELGLSKFIIVALDQAEYHRLKHKGVHVAWSPELNLNYTNTRFRTKEYNVIVNFKWNIVLTLLRHGYDTLLTDVDIYWRQNPLPYLRALPYCNMYLSVDLAQLKNRGPGTPENRALYPPWPQEGFRNNVNTGFCLLRSHPNVIAAAHKIISHPQEGMDDQWTFNFHFNNTFKAEESWSTDTHDSHTCANYGETTFHILRPDLFQNRPIFIQNPQYNESYTIHFNYLPSFKAKIDFMVDKGFMAKENCHQ